MKLCYGNRILITQEQFLMVDSSGKINVSFQTRHTSKIDTSKNDNMICCVNTFSKIDTSFLLQGSLASKSVKNFIWAWSYPSPRRNICLKVYLYGFLVVNGSSQKIPPSHTFSSNIYSICPKRMVCTNSHMSYSMEQPKQPKPLVSP